MKKRFFLLMAVIIIVSAACSLPAAAAPAPTAAAAAAQTPIPAATDLPATLPPAPAPTETQAVPTTEPTAAIGPLFTFSWVKLYIPTAVAAGGLSDVISAVANSPDVAPWDIAPMHEQVPLSGYPLANTFHEPRLYIYPVQDFIALDSAFADRVAELQGILAQRPADPPIVPSLPPWNAGRTFYASPAYVDFQNGSGIRFIAQYGQAVMPINNHELFYMFQGLTADGKYWVAAVLPIQHPSLPSGVGDPFPADMDAFIANYDTYRQALRADLEAQPADSFTPSIQLLDAMLSTMTVGPTGP